MSGEKPFCFTAARPYDDTMVDIIIDVGGSNLHVGFCERDSADDINAAVERREAALRGPLAALIEGTQAASRGDESLVYVNGKALDAALAALGPNPPDYVPRAELDAANANLKALQASLDLLDSREDMTAQMVADWLEEAGLKKPRKPEEWSDEEFVDRARVTLAEAQRRRKRGWSGPLSAVLEDFARDVLAEKIRGLDDEAAQARQARDEVERLRRRMHDEVSAAFAACGIEPNAESLHEAYEVMRDGFDVGVDFNVATVGDEVAVRLQRRHPRRKRLAR